MVGHRPRLFAELWCELGRRKTRFGQVGFLKRRISDMSIAKIIEISAASPVGFEEAIREGIARASRTLENIQGAWIKEQKIVVEDGQVTEYRVDMKVTFLLRTEQE
jgi:hypothetical protein